MSTAPPSAPPRGRRLLNLRRGVQVGNLLLFLLLLLAPALGWWAPLPLDLYGSLDPVAGLGAALAARTLGAGLLLGLTTLAVTALVGRIFCGWVCPLGTLIDGVGWIGGLLRGALRRAGAGDPGRRGRDAPKEWTPATGRSWKLWLLLALLGAGALGLPLASVVAPLPLLTRGLALLGWPQVATPVAPPPVGMATAGLLAGALLVLVLAASLLTRRFWCRTLCPLGGLLTLVARLAPVRLRSQGCNQCERCLQACPMGVRSLRGGHEDSECTRCYSCAAVCRPAKISLGRVTLHTARGGAPVAVGRRAALASVVTGVALGASRRVLARPDDGPGPLRPPHAVAEGTFVAQCVRCGACVRACPTGTLRSLLFERGALGLWTPELVPSLGACRPECTACSDVCPTGAIAAFEQSTKYTQKVGTAEFRLRYCIAYGPSARRCGRCLEVCPTDAFLVHRCASTGLPKPRAVFFERCVGCGLCEYACTVETRGWPALTVSAQGRGEPATPGPGAKPPGPAASAGRRSQP